MDVLRSAFSQISPVQIDFSFASGHNERMRFPQKNSIAGMAWIFVLSAYNSPVYSSELDTWMKRESDDLKAFSVKAYDSKIDLQAMATAKPALIYPESSDKPYLLIAPLAADSEMQCQLYSQHQAISQIIAQHFQTQKKDFIKSEISYLNVDHVDGLPYIRIDLFYTFKDKAGAEHLGLTKYAASGHNQTPVVCHHDDLGYHQSFEKSFKKIVESYHNYVGPKAPPYTYQAIYKISDQKNAVGFNVFYLDTRYKSKNITSINWVSMLVPKNSGDFSFYDTQMTETSEPSGPLISGQYTLVDEDETAEIKISSNKSRKRYLVTSKSNNEVLKEKFRIKEDVYGNYGHLLKAHHIGFSESASESHSVNLLEYNPFLQPLELTQVDLTKTETDDNLAKISMKAGNQSSTFVIRNDFQLEEMSFGNAKQGLKISPMWTEGAYYSPQKSNLDSKPTSSSK